MIGQVLQRNAIMICAISTEPLRILGIQVTKEEKNVITTLSRIASNKLGIIS